MREDCVVVSSVLKAHDAPALHLRCVEALGSLD